MKKVNLFVPLILACAFSLHAQTNYPPVDNFVLVTNLWYQGSKSNVLAIAEQRLAANPNDLAGLVLKMEYDFSFLNFSSISNSMLAVIHAVQAISNNNSHVSSHTYEITNELTSVLLLLRDVYRPTPAEVEHDRAKAFLIHKTMTFEDYLKWIHEDGLF